MKKKGELLIENVVFILLNMAFLTILVLFLMKQGTGAVFMEEAYSKQLALIADSAEPGMIMELNFREALDVVKENGHDFSKIISVNGNFINVQLSENSGKEYHFFNDVKIETYPAIDKETGGYSGIYVMTVSKNDQE